MAIPSWFVSATNQTARKKEGTVIRILERNTQTVVGTYTETKSFGFVIPDDKNHKRYLHSEIR